MKALVVLTVLSLALAGCGKKDKLSQADMEAIVDEALDQLLVDLGPGGDANGAEITFPVDAGFGTVTVPLDLAIDDEGMRIDGSFGFGSSKATVAAYCSAERLVVVTDGLDNFGEEDVSIESRNLAGTCTRLDGGTDLLGDFGGVNELADRGDRIAFQEASKEDGVVTATFLDRATDATLTVSVDDVVQVIRADTGEGALTMTFSYGASTTVHPPAADIKVPAAVQWSLQKGSAAGDPGIITIEAGELEIEAYHIRAYGTSNVPCSGGPRPLVDFDLSRGLKQSKDGYSVDVRDDGDGILDAGDRIFLEHPESFEEGWPYHVEVWDGWSDTRAHADCRGIPGPAPVVLAVGLLGLVAFLRRRA